MLASRMEMKRPSRLHACGSCSHVGPMWMTSWIASKSTACVELFLLTFLVTSVPATMRCSTSLTRILRACSSGGGKNCSMRSSLICSHGVGMP